MKREVEAPRPVRRLRPGWFSLPKVSRLELAAPEWLRGKRLLFVADVHLRRSVDDARLDALIGRIAGVGADMLLLGGDYAESEEDCCRFFRALGRLRFPLGAFGVLGNNDRMDHEQLRKRMGDAGVTLLVNEARSVRLPGGELVIGGCDEHKRGEPRTANLFPRGGGYRVLLSHYPAPPECDCELMLCGHTHAGQFRLLGLTPYSLGFERKYRLMGLEGLHKIGDMNLVVSAGIGASKLPLRLNAEPEMCSIEFSEMSRAKLPEISDEKLSR